MAKKRIRKTTPEERARWRENHERLQEVIDRRLAEEKAAGLHFQEPLPRSVPSKSGKTPPEEKARQLENQRRLQEIIERRLAQEAVDPGVQARRSQRSS